MDMKNLLKFFYMVIQHIILIYLNRQSVLNKCSNISAFRNISETINLVLAIIISFILNIIGGLSAVQF